MAVFKMRLASALGFGRVEGLARALLVQDVAAPRAIQVCGARNHVFWYLEWSAAKSDHGASLKNALRGNPLSVLIDILHSTITVEDVIVFLVLLALIAVIFFGSRFRR